MPDPFPQKHESSIDEIAIRCRIFQFCLDLRRKVSSDSLVRIENQHPFILPPNIFQRPIFLLGKPPIPVELDDCSAGPLR